MNFKTLYDKFKNLKFSCNITKFFTINKILFGSGGSNNIILDVKDKNNNELLIKIIPERIYFNYRTKPNYDQLEIKFSYLDESSTNSQRL